MDQKFTLTAFGAWSCWVLGMTLGAIDVFVEVQLLSVSIAILFGGVCLTVRAVVRSEVGKLATIFQMGREAERRVAGAGVRSV